MKLPKHFLNKVILFLGILIAANVSDISAQEIGELNKNTPDSLQQILKQMESDASPGRVQILPDDPRILDLLWKHVNYNDSIGIWGYKVIIYNGRDRHQANEAHAKFLNAFPNLEVPNGVYYPEPPDFRTMVGAYRTKEEAYALQQKIKSVFEFCYLGWVRLEKGELD